MKKFELLEKIDIGESTQTHWETESGFWRVEQKQLWKIKNLTTGEVTTKEIEAVFGSVGVGSRWDLCPHCGYIVWGGEAECHC